jgi:hypothetical protein
VDQKEIPMVNIYKDQHGMSIVGQGEKITLCMLLSLIAADLLNIYFPQNLKLTW